LDAAFAIARKEGIDGLNIRKLAKACNIAIGSVYNYFPNKDAVLAACRKRFWQEILTDQEKLARNGMGFTDFLMQYYGFLYSRLSQDDNSWLRVVDEDIEEEILNLLRKVLAGDGRINGAIWNLELAPETFLGNVWSNLLALLQAGENDCRFYIFLLEHLLYEGR